MFKVNDYVVYGQTGLCMIADIRKDEYNDSDETEYYVLQPVYENNMTIMIPVDNPPSTMRAIITKDDVLSLIAMMPKQETVWIDNDLQRTSNFKAAIRTGKPEEWIKVIKTIYLEKQARTLIGKKLPKTDEDLLHTAEKNLNEEFAVVLNISPNEVVPYILEHTP